MMLAGHIMLDIIRIEKELKRMSIKYSFIINVGYYRYCNSKDRFAEPLTDMLYFLDLNFEEF